MTKAVRAKMNALSDRVNQVLKNAVASFGTEQIRFIDYDHDFEFKRFCEDGFVEPQRKGQDRPGRSHSSVVHPGRRSLPATAYTQKALSRGQPSPKIC